VIRPFDELAEVVSRTVPFDRMTLFLPGRRLDYATRSSTATPLVTSIIPLFAGGALVGRLHVARSGSPFTQEERNTLAYLSPHLAVSVHSIAQSDVRRRLLDEAEALLEIGETTAALHVPTEVVERALDVVARYLPFPTQFAIFGDPDENGRWSLLGARTPDTPKLYALQELRLMSADLGAERAAAVHAGTPYFAPDATIENSVVAEFATKFGARSLLTVPLRSGELTLGAVFVCDPTTNIAFTAAERKLIRGVADQVSISLRNARLVRENLQSVDSLRALSKRLWTVQEEERERIARELHDEAGQAMTALKLNLDLARREPDLARVRTRIAEAVELAGTVLDELRRISSDLRPGGLHELGLVPTLRALVDGFGKRNAIAADFDTTAEVVPHPDSEAASTAFRFVQEALTNVARHAHATQVRVSLETSASGLLRVCVEDNGVGFGSSARVLDSQLGLLGMRERARVLGGSLKLEGAEEKGARLVLEIPDA
jgi:signal transduction histidine kinase